MLLPALYLIFSIFISSESGFRIIFLIIGLFLFNLSSRGKTILSNNFHGVIWSFYKLLSVAMGAIVILFVISSNFTSIKYILNSLLGYPDLAWYMRLIFFTIVTFMFISIIYFLIDLFGNAVMLINKRNIKLPQLQYKSFEINLSQDSINEKDVLKRLNDKILEYWRKNQMSIDTLNFDRTIYKPWQAIIKLFTSGMIESPSPYKRILEKCETLQRRLAGSVSISKDFGSNPNTSSTIANNLPINLDIPIGKISKNKTVNYPIASAKEAEDELVDIMKDICDYRNINNAIPEFIFIIDELDKIEPQSSAVLDERELSDPQTESTLTYATSRDYRKRQEAVARLLANLKGFLNIAKSKFFFIGGRELFDADLADIADRDSFYSSIFNDVLYLESFYRDKPENDGKRGITSLIEEYLLKLILTQSDIQIQKSEDQSKGTKPLQQEEFSYNLKNLSTIIQNEKGDFNIPNYKISDKANFKIISLLQNYIIYLTYRSTGTPKKLVSLIEGLLVQKKIKDIKDEALILCRKSTVTSDERVFLRFNYTSQYEINLTTDILRPYLIQNSRYLTNLGDKLLFSTPFIFDHIIKFYPYGFSWRNLEMIPEVVLVNKEPYLRDHIKSILRYLNNYQIKQAVSGLYDYRFHSLLRKELSILTKRSDLASAAFNFTLDESLLVKRHYKKRLLKLESKYQSYVPLQGDNQFVHSISFLHTIIGDLHFYDKEYDEAINFYTESIQALRLPNGIDDKYLTRHQFLIWLRNKLKIGLTLEKFEAFDSALSLYRTLMIDSERYLGAIVHGETNNSNNVNNRKSLLSQLLSSEPAKEYDPRSENHRNMHLITLPFVAHLAALEKHRTDGISYANLYQNKEELRRVIEPKYSPLAKSGKKGSIIQTYLLEDDYRKGWIWSDYFSNIGSILFYKNCQFTRLFTPNAYKDILIPPAGSSKKDVRNEYEILEPINISEQRIYEKGKSEYDEDNKQDEQGYAYFDNRFYLKTDFPVFFKSLQDHYNKVEDNNPRRKYFFPSLSSLCYYWESLHELTKYQSHRILLDLNKESSKNECSPLVFAAMYLHPQYFDMVSGKRFYYLANIVSKIGDTIFASLYNEIIENKNLSTIKLYEDWDHILTKGGASIIKPDEC